MKKWPRSYRYLGVVGALLVPALAVAAFNLPHGFMAGEVLTAANLNNNFNAVKQELESLQSRVTTLENGTVSKAEYQALAARVAALETSSTELNRVSLKSCKWHYEQCNNIPAFQECTAVCPVGTYALAGGCDAANASSMSEDRPAPPGPPFPPSGSSAKLYDRYVCEASEGTFQNTYVLCCNL